MLVTGTPLEDEGPLGQQDGGGDGVEAQATCVKSKIPSPGWQSERSNSPSEFGSLP